MTPTPSNPVSDEAVKAKTGKTWDEWFAALDAAGAAGKSHKEIVAILHNDHGVGPWWQQMVTVGYERARGLRAVHETSRGYEASASKTIAAPAAALFKAWKDTRSRGRWLPDAGLAVASAADDKRITFRGADGTRITVFFYPKGDAKTQVTVQHTGLADAEAVAREKVYWGEALGRLKERLEK